MGPSRSRSQVCRDDFLNGQCRRHAVWYPNSVDKIARVLRESGSIVPYGAGYSHEAASNCQENVIDLSRLNRITMVDISEGIIHVEPGVTIAQLYREILPHNLWPGVLPAVPNATIGGCLSINEHGPDSRSIGDSVQAIELLLSSGTIETISASSTPSNPFNAVIGGLGMLGIITGITLHLPHVQADSLYTYQRHAASFDEMFTIFENEASQTLFLAGLVNGHATREHLGEGDIIYSKLTSENRPVLPVRRSSPAQSWRQFFSGRQSDSDFLSLITSHVSDHARYPGQYRFFQPFVPLKNARKVFTTLLEHSQQERFPPYRCVLRRHREDPYMLGHELAGYSLELVYEATSRDRDRITNLLRKMLALVIDNGGHLYLGNDDILDTDTFAQSIGRERVNEFLDIKQNHDPDGRFQSDLFRRLFPRVETEM